MWRDTFTVQLELLISLFILSPGATSSKQLASHQFKYQRHVVPSYTTYVDKLDSPLTTLSTISTKILLVSAENFEVYADENVLRKLRQNSNQDG